jgi:hypothetical protein
MGSEGVRMWEYGGKKKRQKENQGKTHYPIRIVAKKEEKEGRRRVVGEAKFGGDLLQRTNHPSISPGRLGFWSVSLLSSYPARPIPSTFRYGSVHLSGKYLKNHFHQKIKIWRKDI